jgi:mRNA interferase MazF
MKRGEVWEADLPPPIKRRPVLIIARDSLPPGRGEITVAYLTSNARHTPAEVPLTAAEDGVKKDSVVNLDSINTVSKKRLLYRVCTLSDDRMLEVAAAIRYALQVP